MPSSNPLPPKENALFKRILRCYEHKQYKNGLKFAKQILSNPKYTEHGETLAMKGLTLNCLGRKDEAYEHVLRGLRSDLKSHVCWHVYGLLQRSDKKYDEAIKCYRNALKREKDNLEILRDLSLLQIQMRDMEGYKDTRYQLFMLRPTQRASWIGFAMSYHLLGDFEMANSILETFRTSLLKSASVDYEHSELLLYQNQLIAEAGHYSEALSHLEKYSDQILDKLAVKETSGDFLLKLKRYEEAVDIYEALICRNPENTTYYANLIQAKQLESLSDKVAFYLDYQSKYPSAIAPKRLALDFAEGDQFKELLDLYLRKGLHKGVPPLFVDIRSLYDDKNKVSTIEKMLHQYVTNLAATGHFASEDVQEPQQPASTLLWTYHFLAQHYDHLKDVQKALEYIDAAIEHTPTLIELFVTKGKIFKHAGDPEEAFKWLDEAQALDTADRYINSKCAKYMLRANLISEAESTCAKFTREGVSAMENLNEMQCMWFQTECALAFQRMGKPGDALKKCHEVNRHFTEIIEDQFDFHAYCMRKMTLRSYVGLLRLEDVLRGHPFYFRAARCAIQVYIGLHDRPLKDEAAEQELNTENLAPSELKKLRNKQRKAKKKAEQEREQAAQALIKREQHNKRQNENDPETPVLDELIPDKLARVDDPLEQAIKFLQPLQTLASANIETHLMAFEIYYRKNKLLLMLQSIKRALRVAPHHPEVHTCVIRFHKAVTGALPSMDPAVQAVVDKEVEPIFKNRLAEDMNTLFLQTNSTDIRCALAGARMMYHLDEQKLNEAVRLITSYDLTHATLEESTKVLHSLQNGDFGTCDKQIIEDYILKCHERFPYASAFKNPNDKAVASTSQNACIKEEHVN